MNTDQFTSMLRVLLAAGGPVAGLLTNAGLNAGAVTNILTVALIVLPPIVSGIWGYVVHTDRSKLAAAAAVPGVTQINVAQFATGAASAAASDPTLPTVKKVL